jgi:hypothetical protein
MRFARILQSSAIAALAVAVSIFAGIKPEASAAETGAILPVVPCEALANLDFTALDARITAAMTVTRNGHPFCNVKGYISPATQFDALLPTET